MDDKKGKFHYFAHFTLLELLVVITIILVIMAILLPAINKARGKAKAVVCLGKMKQQLLSLGSTNN